MADVAEKERRILVAMDEGEESMYALSWCLKNVVQSSKDTLILVYAKPPQALYMPVMPFDGTGYRFSGDMYAAVENYSGEVANGVVEKAKKICRDVLHEQDVKVETKIESGDARDVICHLVEQLGADILVMGSHGYGLIQRAFLGSVSNHCVQNVKCPVLIVKKPKTINNGNK